MIRHLTVLIAVGWAITACDRPGAEETSVANGAEPPAGSTPSSDANASTNPHRGRYTPGAKLRVLRDAKCEEFGADAFPEPWDISKGAFVIWVDEEGPYTIVEHAPGMQCRIASDAVGPY